MIRYLNLSKIISYFLSDSNNDRYLNPSYFLTNPLALSKIIGESFAPCQRFYHKLRNFHIMFYPIKWYQDQDH